MQNLIAKTQESLLPDSPFTETMNWSELTSTLASSRSWQDKYRFIMQLGKKLSPLSDELKTDDFKVDGCESEVWLICQQNAEGQLIAYADSDARIVKGLLVIVLLCVAQGQRDSVTGIRATFEELGLERHLSPSRTNGLHAIMSVLDGV